MRDQNLFRRRSVAKDPLPSLPFLELAVTILVDLSNSRRAHSSLHLATVPAFAGIYRRCHFHAGPGNRRNHRHFHPDRRGDAALVCRSPIPPLLYRIGDGDDCCVEGGPQDRWGMFSFPLYERLKARDAGVRRTGRLSGRRRPPERPPPGRRARAKPLRAEYVTGNYFSTLGVKRVWRPSFHVRTTTSRPPLPSP